MGRSHREVGRSRCRPDIIRVHSFAVFSRAQVLDLRVAAATDSLGSDRARHACSLEMQRLVSYWVISYARPAEVSQRRPAIACL